VPVLEAVTFAIFSEVQRTLSGGVGGVRHVWGSYVGLRHVKAENEDLKRQLAAAEIALQEQRALADRARGLQKLLELRDHLELGTTGAEIIGSSASPDFRTLTIDKGTREGVRPDMAVIAPAGVVGRVVVPSARSAKVQLLIDRNAAAAVIVERTRAQGVVVGGDNDRLQMQYVSEASDVAVGDLVVTSGIDTIYPKGLVIGKVETVEKNGPAFKKIVVRPAVDFSQIEEVLIVLTPTPAKEASGGVSE
jgi:rod shape-determining protein MreC